MTAIQNPDDCFPDHIRTVIARYTEALGRVDGETLVIGSGTVGKRFLDDIPYPFKVNPHFNQWVPLTDLPDCYLVFRPGKKPRLLLHTPTDFWHKPPQVPSAAWTEAFEIESFSEVDALIGTLPQPGPGLVYLGETAPWQNADFQHNPAALLNAIHFHRAWKTEYELICLREANRLGALGHYAARDCFYSGGSEFELQAAFCRACSHTEQELPYPAIVALNEHGSTLHYDALDRDPPGSHHSFLIDAGASFRGYASDITRTWSARDPQFEELIQAVDRLQQQLCSEVRPGINFAELHRRAHELVAQVLAEWELVRMSPENMVTAGITRHFFPHGLGHYIGLQVHDVGGYLADPDGTPLERPQDHPFLRMSRELDADQTLTIEPGIYFIDSLLAELREGSHARDVDWGRVDRLRPFGGVRIEDDVRVTSHGVENMTRQAFAGVQHDASGNGNSRIA